MAGYISGNTRITGQGTISTVPIAAGGFSQTFTFGNSAVIGFQTFATAGNSSGILAYSAQTYVFSFDSGDTWTDPQPLPANTACLQILQTNDSAANITIVNTTTDGLVNIIDTQPPTQASPVLPAPTPVTLPSPGGTVPTNVTAVSAAVYPYPATAPIAPVWYIARGNAVYRSIVAVPTQTSDWQVEVLPSPQNITSVATDGVGDVVVTTQDNIYISTDGATTFQETQASVDQSNLQTAAYSEYANSFVIGGDNGQLYQANVMSAQDNSWSSVNTDPDANTGNIVQISSSKKDNCTLVTAVQDVAITAAKGVVWKALLGPYSLLGSLAEYVFLPKKPSAALCYAGRTFLGNQDGSVDVQQNTAIDAGFFRNGFGYIVRATNKTYTWGQIAALGNIQAEVQSQLGPGWSTLDINDLNTGGTGPVTVTTRDEYRNIGINMNNVYPYQVYSNGAPTSAAILGYITNGNVYATPDWGYKLAYAGETDVRNAPINLSVYGAPGSGFWPQSGTGNSISNAEIVVTNSSTTVNYPIIAKLATSQQILATPLTSTGGSAGSAITYNQGNAVYRVVNYSSSTNLGNIQITQAGNGVYSNFDLIAVGGGGGGGCSYYYYDARSSSFPGYRGYDGSGGGGGGVIIETAIASQIGNITCQAGAGAPATFTTGPVVTNQSNGGNSQYQLWSMGATRYAVGGGGGAGVDGGSTVRNNTTPPNAPATAGAAGGSGGGGFSNGAGGVGVTGQGYDGASSTSTNTPAGGGGAGGPAVGANAGPGIQTDIITGSMAWVGGGGPTWSSPPPTTGGSYLASGGGKGGWDSNYTGVATGVAGGGAQGGLGTTSPSPANYYTARAGAGGVWIRYRVK